MEHRRILIFGATGQIGTALRKALITPKPVTSRPEPGRTSCLIRPAASATKFDVVALSHEDADLTSPVEIRAAIRGALPHIIINAAGYNDMDAAEAAPRLAETINAEAVQIMTEEAAKRGAIFIHYSSDCVFDGRKTRPYSEKDATAPFSAYGRSKLAGEIAAARYSQHLIFRTGWLYSATHFGFPQDILQKALEHQVAGRQPDMSGCATKRAHQIAGRRSATKSKKYAPPRLFVMAGQIGAPTPASLIGDVTARILNQIYINPAFGLYHLTASGHTSLSGFARYVLGRAKFAGLPLTLAAKDVAEISPDKAAVPDLHPQNARLDCRKFSGTFGIPLPDWRLVVDPELNALFSHQADQAELGGGL